MTPEETVNEFIARVVGKDLEACKTEIYDVLGLGQDYPDPGVGHFDAQFTTVADRWLQATEALGGRATPWNVPSASTACRRSHGKSRPA